MKKLKIIQKIFITLGAGDLLTNISPVGTYQLIQSSNYKNKDHIILFELEK